MAHYRWMWRTVGKNLSGYWWDFRNGICNIPVFWKAMWRFHSWDYSGMLRFMEISARKMRESQRRGTHHTDWEKCEKQLMVVENLCRRLREEPYAEMHGEIHDKVWANRWSASEKYDAIYLGKMMKFVQYWWD